MAPIQWSQSRREKETTSKIEDEYKYTKGKILSVKFRWTGGDRFRGWIHGWKSIEQAICEREDQWPECRKISFGGSWRCMFFQWDFTLSMEFATSLFWSWGLQLWSIWFITPSLARYQNCWCAQSLVVVAFCAISQPKALKGIQYKGLYQPSS